MNNKDKESNANKTFSVILWIGSWQQAINKADGNLIIITSASHTHNIQQKKT